jgi:hypothetical protein
MRASSIIGKLKPCWEKFPPLGGVTPASTGLEGLS